MRQRRSVKGVVKRWKISIETFPWNRATLNDDTFIFFLDHGRLESSDDGLLPTAASIPFRRLDPEAQTYLVKHVLQALLRQSRALHIFHRSEFPCEPFSQFTRYRSLLLSSKLLNDLAVVPQIDLRADDEARHTRTMMVYFWEPFFLDVFKGGRRGNTKANEENVRLRV